MRKCSSILRRYPILFASNKTSNPFNYTNSLKHWAIVETKRFPIAPRTDAQNVDTA